MISRKYNCIFVHIPKAAGQSIETVFIELHGLSWKERGALLLRSNNDPSKGPPRLAHLTASEYLTCNYVSEDFFNNCFKFSFVRNPWDKIVSTYKFRKYGFDFKSFLFKYFPDKNNDWNQKEKFNYRQVRPQYNFIYDQNGKKLVDFVGKFENLQNDFNTVCESIGLNCIVLPHRNKSNIQRTFWEKLIQKFRNRTLNHYSSYYDDESKEFVEDFYEKDIKFFNYEFEKI